MLEQYTRVTSEENAVKNNVIGNKSSVVIQIFGREGVCRGIPKGRVLSTLLWDILAEYLSEEKKIGFKISRLTEDLFICWLKIKLFF